MKMIQLPPTLRLATIERDCSRCAECGKDNTKLDVHDIISIHNDGKHLLENLRPLCSKCHRILEPSRIKRPHSNMNQAITMTVAISVTLAVSLVPTVSSVLAFGFGVNATVPIALPNPYTNNSIVKSTIVCQSSDGGLTKECFGLTASESASAYHYGKMAAIKDFKDFKIHPKTYSSSDTPPPCGPSVACVASYVKFHEGYYDEWTHLCNCNATAALGSRSVSHLFVPN
jgi:HNH endonuclease